MKQIFKITTKQVLWTMSLVVLFALPVGTFAQTFPGAGGGSIPLTGTGGFPCAGGPTTSVAPVTLVGTIGTNLEITNVTIDLTHTWNGDLDITLISPSGTMFDLSSDNGSFTDDYTNTVFANSTTGPDQCDAEVEAPSIETGTGPFTGTFAPEGGDFNMAFNMEAVAGTWTLSVCDDTGGDVGFLNSFSISFAGINDCELVCSPDIVVGTTPDKCGASLVVPLPTTLTSMTGSGCVFVPGGEPELCEYLLPDGSTTNMLPDGCFPLGTTTVFFAATASGSGVSSVVRCTTDVTVIDDDGPVLNCPVDRTINLMGGECGSTEEFEVTAIDNCGMDIDDVVELGDSGCDPAMNATGAVNGFLCPAPFGELHYLFAFTGAPGAMMDEFCYNPFVAANNISITLNIYCWDGNLGAIPNSSGGDVTGATPFYTTTFLTDVGTNFGVQCVSLAGAVTPFPMCDNLIIEIIAPEGNVLAGGYPTCGAVNNETFLAGCGIVNALDLGAITGDHSPGSLQYDVPAVTVGPLGDLDSGDDLGIGVNTFTYIATDAAGNTSTCEFDIVINGPTNVVTSLACNDQVNISIDENCEFFIGADLFLEGGPYSCYDDCYEVYIFDANDQPIPGITMDGFGNMIDYNGSNMSLECGNYVARVQDICESDNSCWGEFLVEDKVAPVVTAPDDITLSCLQSTDPIETVEATIVVGSENATNVWAENTYAANTVTLTDNIMALPNIPNAVITDINVCLGIDNNDLDDFDINLVGPDGVTSVQIYNGNAAGANCAGDDNMDATFDSESTFPVSCVAIFANGNTDPIDETCPMSWMGLGGADLRGTFIPSGQNSGLDAGLSTFYGLPLNGGAFSWNISHRFTDNSGCVSKFELVISYSVAGAGVVTVDNTCGNEVTTFEDVEQETPICGQTVITRTYISTDDKGNQGSDVQVITVDGVGLDALNNSWFWPDAAVDLTCGADTDPDAVFETCKATWIANNPRLPSVDINEYNANANSAGVTCAYPYVFIDRGFGPLKESFLDNSCELFFTFSDQVIEACGVGCAGNSKVLRTWTALDWCTGMTSDLYVQVLNAKDTEAPEIDLVDEITVSASPWGCAASFILPVPEHLRDNCSDDVTYTVYGAPGTSTSQDASPIFEDGQWRVYGLPKSKDDDGDGIVDLATYIYAAEDCCGNITNEVLLVRVIDATAPVATATQNIVINLTASPSDPDGGVAKLYATSVDNGSHDGDCGPVRLAVRRTDAVNQIASQGGNINDCGSLGLVYNVAGDRHNNNATFFAQREPLFAGGDILNDNDQPANHDQHDDDEGEYVKFCLMIYLLDQELM